MASRVHVVTARHCLGSAGVHEEVQVTVPDGRQLAARILGVDEDHDVALLRLSEPVVWPAQIWGEAVLTSRWFSPFVPDIGSDGHLRGRVNYPHARRLLETGGEVDAVELLNESSPLDYRGYSGGPVLDEEDDTVVFGIIVEQLRDRLRGDFATNVLIAIPSSTVLRIFDADLNVGPLLRRGAETEVAGIRRRVQAGQGSDEDRRILDKLDKTVNVMGEVVAANRRGQVSDKKVYRMLDMSGEKAAILLFHADPAKEPG